MKGRAPLAETRRRIFAQAVRRGVTYRQLATITGTSTSIIHEALASMNTTKNDPLREPVELDSKGRPK